MYTTLRQPTSETVTLQSIGHVLGTPASELKTGDKMMWNFGTVTTVGKILKETAKSIVIEDIAGDGKVYERMLRKNRLVVKLTA